MSELAPDITDAMVRQLVDAQFPQWRDLSLVRFLGEGTDNAVYRLGEKLSVRLPRVARVAQTARREQAMLSRFQTLPVPVPFPDGAGKPGFGYPWHWSVISWIEGAALNTKRPEKQSLWAKQLGETVLAIRAVPADDQFLFCEQNHFRGAPLEARDAPFQHAAGVLADEFDTQKLQRVWAMARGVGDLGPRLWLHGDLHGGNLLERGGELAGVIDWGLAGVGDGACDLSAAWVIFENEGRDAFRKALAATDAEWLRGAGWALSIACIFVAYYRDMEGVPCEMSRRTISNVLADFT